MRRLVDNADLTQKQIYDCLASDVRSHTQLKNRLISRYGSQKEKIEAAVNYWGF
jgi:hypothetical protein